MKMIFEPDIEGCDFLEIGLTEVDYDLIYTTGTTKEFLKGLYGERAINIHIRLLPNNQLEDEEEMP